ncbi:hypothetical protein HK102_002005 [Quaeritorhiza haematococci]|nr:hypothetical protein HK102_002005 [Quaeritorhiza haematococci]
MNKTTKRKDNYVPEVSALAVDNVNIEIDADTSALFKAMNFENLPNVSVVNPSVAMPSVPGSGFRRDRPSRQ